MENNVLATVGGIAITSNDVDEFLISLGERGRAYNTPEGRGAVLEQLIADKLFLLDARRNLMEADPAFKAQLARVKDSLLSRFAADKAIRDVKVGDKELETYYEENKDKLGGGEVVEASHILVGSAERAKEIYEEIASGKITFEEAAKSWSTCPSGKQGGSLGEFGRGQMVPEFEEAAFAMAEGEITKEPVKTQFGYHLIRLDKHTVKEAPAFEEVKDQLYPILLEEKQRKAYDSRVNQLKILYPVDKTSLV